MDINNIENLMGLKLYSIGRASDMCWMIFSTNKEDVFYSLHLQCPWRIRNHNNMLLSNLDIYESCSDIINEEKWDDSLYECWRFFKKGDDQHLVVTGYGVEE